MSPATDNFIHSLVEMSKAFEELPNVREQLDRANGMIENYAKQVQNLELRLIDRANEADRLHSRIRELEVQRDDAELRFLEADDAKLAAVRAMRSIIDEATGLIDVIQPTPAPAPVAVQSEEQVQGVSVQPDPTPSSSETLSDGLNTGLAQPGESANPPIASSTEALSAPTAPSAEAHVMESIPQTSGATATGPYTGKLYMREPGYINRQDWLAGGGTPEAYDWAPGNPVPEGYTDYPPMDSAAQ